MAGRSRASFSSTFALAALTIVLFAGGVIARTVARRPPESLAAATASMARDRGAGASLVPPDRPDSAFIWGVNGHPLQPGGPYAADGPRLAAQMQRLLGVGATYYRVDVQHDAAGRAAYDGLARVADVASRSHIAILPVLTFPTEAVPSTRDGAARFGRLLGKRFADRFGDSFPVVEVGNELDMFSLRAGLNPFTAHAGEAIADYDQSRLQRAAGVLGGIIDGLKSGAPRVRTIVNFTLAHTFFVSYMAREVPTFDIIGMHVYGGRGAQRPWIAPVDYGRVLARLPPDRPVWITEANRRDATFNESPGDTQGAWVARLARDMYADPRVEAFFVYELYDEYRFRTDADRDNDGEAYFGLFDCGRDPRCLGAVVPKPAADSLARVVASLRSSRR